MPDGNILSEVRSAVGEADDCRAGASVASTRCRAVLLGGLLSLVMTACGANPLPESSADSFPESPVNALLESPGNPRYGYLDQDIVVYWDASAGAEYYFVSVREKSSGRTYYGTEVAADLHFAYIDFYSFDPEDEYLSVVACDGLGCDSIDPTSRAEPLHRSPENLRVSREGSSLQLAWTPVPGATHYEVYVSGDPQDRFCAPVPWSCSLLDGNVVGTAYGFSSATPGAAYAFEVVDRTSDSLTIEWQEKGHDQYYWVAACSDAGCSLLEYDSVASYEFRPEYYRIHRERDGRTQEEALVVDYALVDTSSERSRYVDKGLQPDTIYYYRVEPCNDSGCSLERGQVESRRAAGLTESDGPVDPPSTPTGFRGEKVVIDHGGDNARITWDAVDGATYYEVHIGSAPPKPFDAWVDIGAPLQDQWYRIPPNRGFFGDFQTTSYKVRACNKAGCSQFTDIVTIH